MTEPMNCRVCGNGLRGESVVKLSGMPGAVQNLPATRDNAIASCVTLDVMQCSFCGLVQLTNDPVPYYKDVIRAGSVSPSMRARQHEQFRMFIERFSLVKKNILEIGSGRGEYLSILNELPVNAFGMEHNPEFNRIANQKGLKSFQAYPTDLAGPPDRIVFDAFISTNVLEHAPDPGAFLRSSANLISESGVAMISVPDFEFELNDNYLFSFMSDHLSYFSSDTLRNALSINGFDVVEIFRKQELNVVTAYVKKRRQCDLSAPKDTFFDFNQNINDYMDSILNNGGRIALWGASHLAFSIVSASKTERKISYIVDSAPFKQGRFTPASGLTIFPPHHLREDPVTAVIVICPEYSSEIVAGIKEEYSDLIDHIASFRNGGLEIVK